ncbi:3'(2'),5'-bisphosphate nucleotidase CysQ [Stutzerimonas tarimensis]|uniref:3'(2'),5'-bisphosphate nucleotidase CysQ n=1 Tax=Stutzerimonas tarimensis TaxID=1507735 RepID=A0ABV7T3D3_9GAMM
MIHPYSDAVRQLVMAAGDAILPYWRSELDVQRKQDDSPVTEADLAANAVLVAGLEALDPQIPVLSEEACDLPLAQRAGWSSWWLVDPLDGTKEFIVGSEEFTVNVALVRHGRVVFGVVGVPATGRCYYGGRGLGAWRMDRDEPPVALRVREQTAEPRVMVASRRHSSAAQERMVEDLQQAFGDLELVQVGSSLKICLVGEGAADCYPRLGPTSQWDTAAAQGVLEGAGGELLRVDGRALSYESRADYLNPNFVALPQGVSWAARLLQVAQSAEGTRR